MDNITTYTRTYTKKDGTQSVYTSQYQKSNGKRGRKKLPCNDIKKRAQQLSVEDQKRILYLFDIMEKNEIPLIDIVEKAEELVINANM